MKTNLVKALLAGFIAFTPPARGVAQTRPNDPWKILERVTPSMPEDDAPVQCSKNPRDWYR
jgi:hypothetical protein